jgi:hypothetical protein
MYGSDVVLLLLVNEISLRYNYLSLIYNAYFMRCIRILLA